ncbi:Rrn6p SCDLUD_001519 [Saccharomycodes ludwigii]|uniref:Rrn6p n=1 Tax=Saccharomycodes ludwigii TaxID=36035 RepID=UPI001E872CDC|nr:hypothetical protein SCDLUD_001519 [Saccharomycodes ludwigii]KAH3901746.1 hypothetical protein SCDLUD_001519 [Saccharomycodes ludwigii]
MPRNAIKQEAEFPHYLGRGVQLDIGSNISNVYKLKSLESLLKDNNTTNSNSSNVKESWKISNGSFISPSSKKPRIKTLVPEIYLNLSKDDRISTDEQSEDIVDYESDQKLDSTFSFMYTWDGDSTRGKVHSKVPNVKRKMMTFDGSPEKTTAYAEYNPLLHDPHLRSEILEAEKSVPEFNLELDSNYFTRGYIQTTSDLRLSRNPRELVCYRSTQNTSGLVIKELASGLENRVFFSSDIKKIAIAPICKITMSYSDIITVVLETGIVLFLRIVKIAKGFLDVIQSVPLLPVAFQDNPFVDVSFNPWDKTQFALVDSIGNWVCGKIKTTPSNELLVHLSNNNLGTIFDPEELDYTWRRILWGGNFNSLLVMDRSKIVSVQMDEGSEKHISQNKTWSRILDIFRISDEWTVCLTTREVIILKTGNSSHAISREISWKHYFTNTDDGRVSAILLETGALAVVIYSKNTHLVNILTFEFDRDTSEIILKNKPSVLIVKGGIEYLELTAVKTDESDNKISVLFRLDECILDLKFDLDDNESGVSFVSGICIKDITGFKLTSHEKKLFCDKKLVELFHTIKEDVLRENRIVCNDVDTLESYGFRLSKELDTLIDSIKSIGELANISSAIEDPAEFESFLGQLIEHYSTAYLFTSPLLSFNIFCKEDISSFSSFFYKLAQCMETILPNESACDINHMLRDMVLESCAIYKENFLKKMIQNDVVKLSDTYAGVLNLWDTDRYDDNNNNNNTNNTQNSETDDVSDIKQNIASSLTTPFITISSQPPLVKSSQIKSSSKKRKATQNSQSTLPNIMAPAFSLSSSQQSTTTAAKKKKKKLKKGFF